MIGSNKKDYELSFQCLSDDTCMLTGLCTDVYEGLNIVVPEFAEIDGKKYKVTEIFPEAFKNCNSFTSIFIPETVTYIGPLAFSYCQKLESVAIPNSVTSIGEWAFAGCTALTSVTIPNALTEMGMQIFDGCSSLKLDYGLFLYDNNTKCYGYLGNTKKVKEITVPEGVTHIGEYAFRGCTSLTFIKLPSTLTTIGRNAFHSCKKLTSITIPEGVTSIGKNAFKNCEGLESVNIPSSVSTLGTELFIKCDKLTEVKMPEHLFDLDTGKCAYEKVYKRLKELNKYAVKGFLDSIKKSPGCKYLKLTQCGHAGCEISLIYQSNVLWKETYRTVDLEPKTEDIKAVVASFGLK